MIYRAQGNMRGGKTLTTTAWACLLSTLFNQPIYANYHIQWPNAHYFERWRELENVSDSIIVIDEIATMVDSRNFKSKDQMYFTHLFAQMGKKGNTLFYTSQREHMVEKRVRDQTDYIIDCIKNHETNEITQTWWDSQRSADFPEYINTYRLSPEPIYSLYDTYETVASHLNTSEE